MTLGGFEPSRGAVRAEFPANSGLVVDAASMDNARAVPRCLGLARLDAIAPFRRIIQQTANEMRLSLKRSVPSTAARDRSVDGLALALWEAFEVIRRTHGELPARGVAGQGDS